MLEVRGGYSNADSSFWVGNTTRPASDNTDSQCMGDCEVTDGGDWLRSARVREWNRRRWPDGDGRSRSVREGHWEDDSDGGVKDI